MTTEYVEISVSLKIPKSKWDYQFESEGVIKKCCTQWTRVPHNMSLGKVKWERVNPIFWKGWLPNLKTGVSAPGRTKPYHCSSQRHLNNNHFWIKINTYTYRETDTYKTIMNIINALKLNYISTNWSYFNSKNRISKCPQYLSQIHNSQTTEDLHLNQLNLLQFKE